MKFSAWSFLLLWNLSHASTLRDGLQRQLEADSSAFKPLRCNQNMAPCESFQQRFGEGPFSSRIVIECGKCYTLQGSGSYQFNDGLDIQGKLVIPQPADTSSLLTIETTMIVVQGQFDITAKKSVDGSPNVNIYLKGNADQYYVPVDTNAGKCGASCLAGKRSITVAGGQVNFQGVPNNFPSFLKLQDVEGDSTIVVPRDVEGHWRPGAKLVITSNTQEWAGDQVRTITSVQRDSTTGYTRIGLDDPIERPSTIQDDVGFAVEVAILSRNVVLNSEAGGGHFWVTRTPTVRQTIHGVEVVNFGQAGILGRYPIHFHMCGDVNGSTVSRNTVRQSNQRCYVVHGTDRLMLEENVSYATKGHCYMTEDGIETGNKFIGNIGIRSDKATILIPDMGTNGIESDNKAATFWSTTPSNIWEGNIVAGARVFGFWFEFMKRGVKKDAPEFAHLSNKQDSITSFSNNEAHSVHEVALKFYLNGYDPKTITTLSNLKFSRNNRVAVDLHRTRNIKIVDSLFQDNGVGVLAVLAEEFHMSNTKMIGHSRGYRNVVASTKTGNPRKSCRGSINQLVGIVFEANQRSTGFYESPFNGLILDNIDFSGYEEGNCKTVNTVRLGVEYLRGFKTFDLYSRFDNVQVPANNMGLNFCSGAAKGAKDVYVTDVSGTLGLSPGVPQTLMQDTPFMTKFVATACTAFPSQCLTACPNTCLRSVHVYLDRRDYPNYSMKVCDHADSSECLIVNGASRTGVNFDRYVMHLPSGKEYDVWFMDADGRDVFSLEKQVYYRDKQCTLAPDEADVHFLTHALDETATPTLAPTTYAEMCESLVSPADMSASSWIPYQGGSIVQETSTSIRYVPGADLRADSGPELVTWNSLENRECFLPGTVWEFKARVKLVESGTSGVGARCDPTSTKAFEACPVLFLSLRDANSKYLRALVNGYQILDDWNPDGFNSFSGYFTVPSESEGWIGRPRKLRLHLARFPRGVDLIVDNFDIVTADQARPTPAPSVTPTLLPTTLWPTLVPTTTFDRCGILTGSEDMSASSWIPYQGGSIVQETSTSIRYVPGAYLRADSGPELVTWNSLENRECFLPGTVWEFKARVKLVESGTSGVGARCDPTSTKAFEACPVLFLSLRDANSKYLRALVNGYQILDDWNTDGFNSFSGYFTVPSESEGWIGRPRKLRLHLARFPRGVDLIVDNFDIVTADQARPTPAPSVTPTLLPTTLWPTLVPTTTFDRCGILTGSEDMSASHWSAFKYGSIAQYSSSAVKYLSTGEATSVTGPELVAWNSLDNRNCMMADTTWEFSAKIQLFEMGTNVGTSCDPQSNTVFVQCPVLFLLLRDSDNVLFQAVVRNEMSVSWKPSGLNDFVGSFTVPNGWVGDANSIRVIFSRFPKGKDLVVQDFAVTGIY